MIEVDGTVDDRDLHRGVATRRSLPQNSQTRNVGNWIHEIIPDRSAANSRGRSVFHGNLQFAQRAKKHRYLVASVQLWQLCRKRPIRRGGSERIEAMMGLD
ncbi:MULTISPECIES: hypothetical protein [unclassified Bradyrhizobium]